MQAYLAIKFHENHSNRKLIEQLSNSLLKMGIKSTIMTRDFEKWGSVKYTTKQLMDLTFKEISKSEILIVEFSEKGVGLGIEAGYAYANNIPVIVIAKENSPISNTLKGIAKRIVFYKYPSELPKII